jgi:hypothetical protein
MGSASDYEISSEISLQEQGTSKFKTAKARHLRAEVRQARFERGGGGWLFRWLTAAEVADFRERYRRLYPGRSAAWIDGLIMAGLPDGKTRYADGFPGLSPGQLEALRRDIGGANRHLGAAGVDYLIREVLAGHFELGEVMKRWGRVGDRMRRV